MFSRIRATNKNLSCFMIIAVVSTLLLLLMSAYFKSGVNTQQVKVAVEKNNGYPITPVIAVHRPSHVILQVEKRNKTVSTTLPPYILHQRSSSTTPQQSSISIEKDLSQKPYSVGHVNVDHLLSLIPKVSAENVNCEKIFDGDKTEIAAATKYQSANLKVKVPDEAYASLASNCDEFIKSRHYITEPLNAEEADFPIAYSILMFRDVEQTERLLRAIYRPQNHYCIHVDAKSPTRIHKSISAIASCFDNVFLAQRRVDVQWAWFSVLEPDLICMQDLWKFKKWKYFINLTGQEWPLKTNWDLVKILKTYNGANDMEGTVKRRNIERTEFIHEGFWATKERKKTPVPHGIQLSKGSVHIAASRDFVDFVLHNPIAKDFVEWVKDTGIPDETFFSSLSHSPHLGVPGAYKGEPETNKNNKPFLARFKNWGTWPFDWPCAGQRVRMVCIFALGDLPLLASRPEMFANKFYLDYHPLALDCMEELHFNRTRDEVTGMRKFDTLYYEQLDMVKNHV